MEAINTIGRRKAAVARIYLNDGKGQITVNQKDYKEYRKMPYCDWTYHIPDQEINNTNNKHRGKRRFDIVPCKGMNPVTFIKLH